MVQEREKVLFKEVINLIKNKTDIKIIGDLLKSSLDQVNGATNLSLDDNLFKIKIVLTLGKIYLKSNYNLNELIETIENELKKNFHVCLVSLLYRCYYYRMVVEKDQLKQQQPEKSSLLYSMHQNTSLLIDQVKKDNIQDISMSKYLFVQTNSKITSGGDKIDYEFQIENDIICSICPTIGFKLPINLISCGRYFIMALDNNGFVWNWGKAFEVVSNHQTTPLFPISHEKKFKSIAAGFHHCLALSQDDTVYGWGSNIFGCLGTGDRFTPAPKQLNVGNQKVIKIEAGGFNSAFITASGQLYVLGRNNRLQLGFQQIPSLYPKLDNSRVHLNFVPEISVSQSTLQRDFTLYISNSEFSDIHIQFQFNDGQVETIYLHSVLFLSQLSNNNPKLIENIKNLKQDSSTNNGILILSFKKLLEITSDDSKKDQDIVESILKQPVDDQMNQFLDFVSFIYTNGASKRYSKVLGDDYSKLFKCLQLSHYMYEEFRYISKDSDLNIPDTLYSVAYNNKDFFPDCIVTNGKIEIYCHKVILASRSSKFKQLIQQSTDINQDGLLKLKYNGCTTNVEIQNPDLILTLSYLYSDRIKLVSIPSNEISGNLILTIYQNSKEASLERFGEGLLKLVSQSVNQDNAEPLLKWSQNNKATQLEQYINSFLGNEVAPQLGELGGEGLYKPLCPLPNIKMVDVSVGQKLIVAVTEDNKIYQLGYGSDRTKTHINLITLPKDSYDNSKIIKVSCGSSHCLVLTDSYKVYGFGCGFDGQVIQNKRAMFIEPVLLFDCKYNNMKSGFYSALFWNDYSSFPLSLSNNSSNNNNNSGIGTEINKDLIQQLEKLNINPSDHQIHINIYNFEKENRLWYFKQFKTFKDNFTITMDQSSQPNISNIKTNISNLPPLLIQKYLNNISNNKNEIDLFGFSKDTVEVLLSLSSPTSNREIKSQISQSIKSGDQLIDLLFLSTSLGSLNISDLLFQHLKESINLEDSILLLSCIYESNYSVQLSYIFNYLLGVLNFKKLEILKNDNLLKLLPASLLDVLLNNTLKNH